MSDLFTSSVMFQKMAIKVAASKTAAAMDMQLRILRQQGALFDHMTAQRRADDWHSDEPVNPTAKKRKAGKRPTPCCGPDLLDHYGKRAHDVDVEHI